MEKTDIVGLIVIDQDSRIFVLSTSNEKNQDQFSGTLSIPIEQIADGESVDQALVRLIDKKVGSGKIKVPPTFFKEFTFELGDESTEKLQLFISKSTLGFDTRLKSKDVIFFGWMKPRAIMDFPTRQKRPGLEQIIRSYFAC
jgi:hypothetical protein